jgi:hypothetical protein
MIYAIESENRAGGILSFPTISSKGLGSPSDTTCSNPSTVSTGNWENDRLNNLFEW